MQHARGPAGRRLARVVLERVALGHGLRVLADHVEVEDLGNEVAVGGGEQEAHEHDRHRDPGQDRRRSHPPRPKGRGPCTLVHGPAHSTTRASLDSPAALPQHACGVMLALPDWNELLRSPLFETFSLLVGLIVGSFANVCIHRIPLGESVVSPPSRCPYCGTLVRPYDNVPVLSFLMLGGRCRSCRTLISLRYPIVEATNGLLYLTLAVALRAPDPDGGGDGPLDRAPRPEPHRPRPPHPPRRDHAARDRDRPSRELPARLSLAAPGGGGRRARRATS